MVKSMTGFGSAGAVDAKIGKINLEIKSFNHRFLEIVLNLPAGFMSMEDKLKKEIARKVKRGRIVASFSFSNQSGPPTAINKDVIRGYFHKLEKLRKELLIRDKLNLDALLRLPGTLSLQTKHKTSQSQALLRQLLLTAVNRLELDRRKAGRAIYHDLRKRSAELISRLSSVRIRARKVISAKASSLSSPEEKVAFLKSVDISEELTLLKFHINNFYLNLNKRVPIGKKLDFIAQEMQREVNTLAAKSFDAKVLGHAIEMKTQIEKVREQLQNVE
jgi:uncharacterized protein (TIGR00255 family)